MPGGSGRSAAWRWLRCRCTTRWRREYPTGCSRRSSSPRRTPRCVPRPVLLAPPVVGPTTPPRTRDRMPCGCPLRRHREPDRLGRGAGHPVGPRRDVAQTPRTGGWCQRRRSCPCRRRWRCPAVGPAARAAATAATASAVPFGAGVTATEVLVPTGVGTGGLVIQADRKSGASSSIPTRPTPG